MLQEIEFSQNYEINPIRINNDLFSFRLAYARNKTLKQSAGVGEDYLHIKYNEKKIIFCLCDGVSQSFNGSLGARILGKVLISKISSAKILSKQEFKKEIQEALKIASMKIESDLKNIDISNHPEIIREIFKRQIERYGSQSTFVIGVMDIELNKLWISKIGDSYIKILNEKNHNLYSLNNKNINDRWTSKETHTSEPLFDEYLINDIDKIVLYSDGIPFEERTHELEDNELFLLISEKLGYDDISYFELKIHQDKISKMETSIEEIKAPQVIFKEPEMENIEIFEKSKEEYSYDKIKKERNKAASIFIIIVQILFFVHGYWIYSLLRRK